jgi:uncharacterized protein YqjF (DUF2071 family)
MLGRSLAQAAGTIGEAAVTPLGLVADEIPAQQAVLAEQDHRPWPLPERPWLMGQTWYDLLFAHWRVPAGALRRLVPEPLEVDLYEGEGWLGITPFLIGGLRLHGAPPLPWLSHFPELNVRTYVSYGGRPGIYFFSLDAARLAAVHAARSSYRLPYFHAHMRASRVSGAIDFRSERSGSDFAATYRPVGDRLPIEEGSLERWLAERYCLYVVDENGRPLRADIHHPPWPLEPAGASIERNTMAAQLGIELGGEPLLNYSARQDTLIWTLAPA